MIAKPFILFAVTPPPQAAISDQELSERLAYLVYVLGSPLLLHEAYLSAKRQPTATLSDLYWGLLHAFNSKIAEDLRFQYETPWQQQVAAMTLDAAKHVTSWVERLPGRVEVEPSLSAFSLAGHSGSSLRAPASGAGASSQLPASQQHGSDAPAFRPRAGLQLLLLEGTADMLANLPPLVLPYGVSATFGHYAAMVKQGCHKASTSNHWLIGLDCAEMSASEFTLRYYEAKVEAKDAGGGGDAAPPGHWRLERGADAGQPALSFKLQGQAKEGKFAGAGGVAGAEVLAGGAEVILRRPASKRVTLRATLRVCVSGVLTPAQAERQRAELAGKPPTDHDCARLGVRLVAEERDRPKSGTFGRVYRAENLTWGTPMALKVPNAGRACAEASVNEAKTLSRLGQHDCVVAIER